MVWASPTDPRIDPPEDVSPDESLGRSVHSSKHFKRGESNGKRRDKVFPRAFEPPKDKENPTHRRRDISTDRCQYVVEEKAVELGRQRAEERGNSFHGWAIIRAEPAQREHREVVSSPSEEQDNPAHADIMLPPNTTNDDQARNSHLLKLAENSCWLDRPPTEEQ
jgi:hypothetical protein